MDDMAECDPREVEASRHNLNYIGMDGNIACLGNGWPNDYLFYRLSVLPFFQAFGCLLEFMLCCSD